MTFEEELSNRIDAAVGQAPFVKGCKLAWRHDLEKPTGEFILIIQTNRTFSLKGGDGWNGFDGVDARILGRTVKEFLLEQGEFRVKSILLH